jgi:hypothetical protein
MDPGRHSAVTPSRGLFASRVTGGGLDSDDFNGFATAQVLRALGRSAREMLGAACHDASLDGLLACRNPATGGFRFWPIGRRPAWAPDLPDDADDTALMGLTLYAAGRMSLADLRRTACRTVVCHRLAATPQPGPPWPRVGAFKTWMRYGLAPAIADCTVNANAVALLAAADLRAVPGYAQACAMIADAVAWAGANDARAASLSPFYPEPGEMKLAVECAVAAGAQELCATLTEMRNSPMWWAFRQRSCRENPVICGSAYGLLRWSCRQVGWARRIAGI